MIPPTQHWAIQIDVTNRCHVGCSNCTRSLAHVAEPFDMPVDVFAAAVESLADFPDNSTPNPHGQNCGIKVVGIIGGEPTLHPEYAELCEIIKAGIPRRINRGLWTSSRQDARIAKNLFGYVNFNPHAPPSHHHPILVSIRDVISDEARMWELIDRCPYQTTWASSIGPNGFFFCEVAASLDLVFHGPGGLPVAPGCWREPLEHFRDQITTWCPRCGGAIPMNKSRHRLDAEHVDDVSVSNLKALEQVGSPRILRGDYVVFDVESYSKSEEAVSNPLDYL